MPASRSDWERVGRQLAERRVQISARYANRRVFAEETGLNWRTLYDAEYGKRATFRRETVGAFETALRLVPGSIDRALAGGDLEPLPDLRAVPAGLHPAAPYLAASPPADDAAAEILAGLVKRYEDDPVVRAIGAQHGKDAGTRVTEILRFLKDPDLDREVLAGLMARDDAVIQAIGTQRGKRELIRVTEILEFLGWRPPEMAAGSGTAG